jgi:hypothetical protein
LIDKETIMADIRTLKMLVRGAYDLQSLRIPSGLRLVANFRGKMDQLPHQVAEDEELDLIAEEVGDKEKAAEAKKILDSLRINYRNLTEGVARNRTLPSSKGFVGEGIISEWSELALVDAYMQLERQEKQAFKQMSEVLVFFPIWTEFLLKEPGIGPALGAVIIASFDPTKAHHPSQFWSLAGLSVGPDGAGISRRKEHLVERVYTKKDGTEATKLSTVFNPWLQSKLIAVLGPSLLRAKSPRREAYDGYKNRIVTDPARLKMSDPEKNKRRIAGENVSHIWPPGRIHKAASRFMIKMFLLDLWKVWREQEGLEVTLSYWEAQRGREHGKAG